jgi:hypothetical protein
MFVCFRYEVIRQLAQSPLAIAPVRGFIRTRRHERPHAAARLDHAGALQFRVDLGDRVRVDAQVHGELPHGRQLIANSQFSGRDRKTNRALELVIKRRRMAGVYLEHRVSPLYYDNGTKKFQDSRMVPKFEDEVCTGSCSDRVATMARIEAARMLPGRYRSRY